MTNEDPQPKNTQNLRAARMKSFTVSDDGERVELEFELGDQKGYFEASFSVEVSKRDHETFDAAIAAAHEIAVNKLDGWANALSQAKRRISERL